MNIRSVKQFVKEKWRKFSFEEILFRHDQFL